jgi:drug/metabolite transporter (DMT)-like permease
VSRGTAGSLLVLVVLLWGANWPVMKVALESIPPFAFTAARVVLALAVMTVVAGLLGRLRRPDRRDLPIILSTGLLAMAALMTLTHVALQYVPAGRAAILIYTNPLWVAPLAAVALGERLTTTRIVGLLLGIAGIVVLFNPLGFDWADPDVVLGNLLLLVAAAAWAVQIVHVRGHTWRGSALELFPWQLAVAAAAAVPLAIAFDAGRPVDWSAPLPALVAYTGFVATAFCYLAVIQVNRALPATTTSLVILAVPVAGVLFSAILLGETIDAATAGGLALIVAGVAAVALGERRASPPEIG